MLRNISWCRRKLDCNINPGDLIWQIMRFFSNPRKPMILALARADPKKNITTLVKAFGECRPLRELANLVCCNP
jgi:sucrose-phosphate synthase